MTAFAGDAGFADWDCVIGVWGIGTGNFFFNSAVEIFVLEKDHGIVVANGGFDQSLGVIGGCGAHDFETGSVYEPHLGILRMEGATVDVASAGTAQDQRGGSSPAVVRLCNHVDNLIEGAADEVHELKFGYGTQAGEGGSESRADDGRLGDGCVDDTLGAEAVDESVGDLERSSVNADVLAQTEDCGVAGHFLPDSLADGLEIGQDGHVEEV